jgi:SAM-dependent MidA family methyltransferase
MRVSNNDDVSVASSQLLELIVDEIRRDGPMTFARYMELALYHPEFGYYRRGDRFGVAGDFYTAEQLQPVFGELLASFVDKLTHESGMATIPTLELGAGRGEMGRNLGERGYQAFDWHTGQLPAEWQGLVFANEFFDAMPVHLLVKEEEWHELFVIEEELGALKLQSHPASDARLQRYADRFGTELPTGARLEACLAAADWMETIARMLRAGWLLVIDYGYEAPELSRLGEGTLLSYRSHRAEPVVLRDAGNADITAHVNFSWLTDAAEANGLVRVTSMSLARWAMTVWDEQVFSEKWARADQRWRLQWKQLVFGLGETFRVLMFRKAAGK